MKKKKIVDLLKKAGISKKESIVILAAIYNPLYWFVPFVPTMIAAVYIAAKFFLNLKKRKIKLQE